MPQRRLLVISEARKQFLFPYCATVVEQRMKWGGGEDLKHQRCTWSWRQHVLLLKILICFIYMFLLESMRANDIYPLLIEYNGTYPPLLMLTVLKPLPCTQISWSFEGMAVHAKPSYKRLNQLLLGDRACPSQEDPTGELFRNVLGEDDSSAGPNAHP